MTLYAWTSRFCLEREGGKSERGERGKLEREREGVWEKESVRGEWVEREMYLQMKCNHVDKIIN